uniref:Uncharacterized protein n=1 Tax=Tanacetum cinerariifolium TaxID=118510 RepID=A0A699UAB0_TANCI|nr:hypothetical protein [Tanacetum cinerariifolium]
MPRHQRHVRAPHLLTLDADFAGSGLHQARNYLKQRAFARTAFTGQGQFVVRALAEAEGRHYRRLPLHQADIRYPKQFHRR